ncbi:MAG TPA: hypothetical protein PK629_11220 [Oscillospiraceae bacterium]|nr:hypothetical protein [Oscillospiraceae bacterium]HPF55555.1 hypothetical protein [Clostridiales bacterium]HPR74577.1 hypothetical protein [Oscillospiraceae bacterium]
MDFSSLTVWSVLVQAGIIAGGILLANVLRRKIAFFRKGLVPTAVLAGFLLLLFKSVGVLNFDQNLLETITYHGIAIGFIALSLRVPKIDNKNEKMVASKSGALIVSSYLFQAMIGLIVSIALAYTVMPDLFKASGILLPMGYGQGPGQANNVGTTYETTFGFSGGRSFGLALAAAGYLCACIIGVIYLNILIKKKKIVRKTPEELSGSVTVETFQDKNEIPIAESVDKFSIQAALVLLVYLMTYLVTLGVTTLLGNYLPGVSDTISPLLWGFNFIIGSLLALLTRKVLWLFRKGKIMTRQYQNSYLLSRLSGFAFDIMIVAGITSINFEDLTGLWVPFAIMAVLGGILTLFYLRILCRKIYPNYYYEGLVSMYGMMTGTISSGVLLLREIDPNLETPAANNLVTGSSYGILLGAPLLIIIGLAPKPGMLFISLGIIFVYWALLLTFIYLAGKKRRAL